MRSHPAADIFPLMLDDKLTELAEDIHANGQKHPIVIYEDAVLDGRNRDHACAMLGIEPLTVPWDGAGTPEDFVLSMNAKKRDLTDFQRAFVAADLEERIGNGVKHGRPRKGEEKKGGESATISKSRDKAAKQLRVSAKAVSEAKAIKRHLRSALLRSRTQLRS